MLKTHINSTKKFKTVNIVVKFKAPFNKDNITERFILSKLITKVCEKYPTEKSMHDVSSDLYGANAFSYVSKQNNAHIITVGIELINDKYLSVPVDLLNESSALLEEILKRPLIENGSFDESRVNIEKQLLKSRFDSLKDNKTQYGYQQLMHTMFKGMDYQYPSYGIEEALYDIDGKKIYETYCDMMTNDEKEIFIIGDINEKEVTNIIDHYFDFQSQEVMIQPLALNKIEPVYVTESIDTTQGKINMGFVHSVQFGSPEYFAMIVFNQIFGGDVTSLLFTNVREKQSLAYQVHSQIDAKLGYLFVIAGVKSSARVKAVDTILEQLELIKKGEFDYSLIETAKAMLYSSKKETFDRPRGWIEATYAQEYDGRTLSQQEWLDGIEAVTVLDVMAIASEMHLHTVYCLTDEV